MPQNKSFLTRVKELSGQHFTRPINCTNGHRYSILKGRANYRGETRKDTFYKQRYKYLGTRNMEYISCSIPGCQSKSQRKTEHKTAVGERNILMFPVNANELYKWKEALKGSNIELTSGDYICEHHFLENDIQRYHRTKTPDGDIIEIKKRLPTLKPNAIPIKFLKLNHATEDFSEKLSAFQNSAVIKIERNLTHNLTLDFKSCDSGNNAVKSEFEIISVESLANCADLSVNSEEEQISHQKKCISYNDLVKNIQLVKKPSKPWSVVCTDLFTIFARWNNEFIAEKRLVIENSLTVRVFLKDWEVEMTELVDIKTVDDVSSLLEKVESYSGDFNC